MQYTRNLLTCAFNPIAINPKSKQEARKKGEIFAFFYQSFKIPLYLKIESLNVTRRKHEEY